MGLLTKTKARESERLIAEATKVQVTLDVHLAQAGAAKAEYDLAFEAGDADAMIAAEARQKAHGALVAKQRDILASIGERADIAIKAEEEADFLAYCEGLDRQEAKRGETYGRDYNKAASVLTAFLADDAAKADPVVEANKRRRAMGLPPILTADERARSIPGRVEPAEYADKVVWRKYQGGPEVSVFGRNKAGELVPQEAGAVKSVERVLVRAEREICARRPKSLVETVVLPGLLPTDEPVWPPKGGR